MRKALSILMLYVLVSNSVSAAQVLSAEAGTADTRNDRDIVFGYDNGIFDSFGTSPDWTDLTLVLFEVPPGGWTPICLQLFCFGNTDHEVLLDDTANFDTPPAAPYGTGLFFNPGTSTSEEADWVNIDLCSPGSDLHHA